MIGTVICPPIQQQQQYRVQIVTDHEVLKINSYRAFLSAANQREIRIPSI